MLVCEDLARTLDQLESRGVEVERPAPGGEGPVMGSFTDLYGNAITLVDQESFRFFG